MALSQIDSLIQQFQYDLGNLKSPAYENKNHQQSVFAAEATKDEAEVLSRGINLAQAQLGSGGIAIANNTGSIEQAISLNTKESKPAGGAIIAVAPDDDTIAPDEDGINKDKYYLNNMLVVIICVGEYDLAGASNLPGTQQDKKKLLSLFKDTYKYKVFSHQGARVTTKEMRKILNEARTEFCDNKYDGIIVCFSGHGSDKDLYTSDGKFTRQDFEQFYNGHVCPDEINKYKLYFVDACRGAQDTELVAANKRIMARGNKARAIGIHPESNKCIMYGNANYYVTLETKAGGMLTNAVVDVFTLSLSKSMSFGEMQDKIRKLAAKAGSADGSILPPIENNIDYDITGKITFGRLGDIKLHKEQHVIIDEPKEEIDIENKIKVIRDKYPEISKKCTDDDIKQVLATYNYHLQQTLTGIEQSRKEAELKRKQQQLNELNADCPKGHKLQVFVTAHTRFICDGCKNSIKSNAKLYGCRSCNYDLCTKCHSWLKAYGTLRCVIL